MRTGWLRSRWRAGVTAAVAVLLASGCAGASPATFPDTPAAPSRALSTVAPSPATPGPTPSPSPDVVVSEGVPYTPPAPCTDGAAAPDATCRLVLDVSAPASAASGPLFVLLPGGPGPMSGQGYLSGLAGRLARSGAVAMVVRSRQMPRYGGGSPISLQDIACATGVARRLAPSYGADAGRVTLVGHAFGGWTGAIVALTPTPYTPPVGACLETAGSLLPDAFVDIDGGVDAATPDALYGDDIAVFLGGTRDARPEAWAAADPFALIARGPAGPAAIPFLVIHGDADFVVKPAVSDAFDAALRGAGYASRRLVVPGDHTVALTSPDAVDAMMALAGGS